MMQVILGRSTLAIGIVLAAFMSGLALGSYLIGKYSDRSRNSLRLYAFYEIGTGLAAFVATFLLGRLIPLNVWAHTNFGNSPLVLAICQFLIALTPLMIPTILMGATLPILSRIVVTQLSKVERDLGRLYAINTVGAVIGSLASGFFLIKHLGVHGAVYFAVIGNLAVGALAWLASARSDILNAASPASLSESSIQPPPMDAPTRRKFRIILGVFALSGFASFAYEVFWTRSLVFLMGNTTYAFSLMLTAFLSGIALGGYGIRFVAERFRNPLRLFAIIEVLIGIFSAASLPLLFSIVQSAVIRAIIYLMSGHLGLLALSDFGVALVIMLVPATLIGATFPLMGRVFLDDLTNTGTTVGKVYAVNTVGNVLGALLSGLLILPLMGIQKGILLMATLNIFLGIVIAFSRRKNALATTAATTIVFIVLALGLFRTSINFQFPSEKQTQQDAVLFYKEGSLVTTKVWTSTELDDKIMSIDGINIGGTENTDYKQQILAHLPKLLLKSYRSELSIGLGSGILAGESTRHAGLQRMVCVELARGVVEGARYFSEENFNIVKNPRACIVIDDVINFLHMTKERYDIISADEKTARQYASNSMSYSKDYYMLLMQHLTPGGLVIQWVPTDLPSSQYALAIRTFLDAFPHVMLWYFPPVGRSNFTNTFLVGSNKHIDIDPSWMRQELETNPVSFQGIRKYGLTTADSILAHFIASEETLRRAIPPGPINSFEMPIYEFYSPRDYATPRQERELTNHEWLLSFRGQDYDRFVAKDTTSPNAAHLNAAFQAEGVFLKGHALELKGWKDPTLVPYYEQAIGMAPWDMNLRNEVAISFYIFAKECAARGDYPRAATYFRRATEIFPESPEFHYQYGVMMLQFMNNANPSIKEFQQALSLNPSFVPALRSLGAIYASLGNMDKALELWQKALALNPNDVIALIFNGQYLMKHTGSSEEGMEYLRRAYSLAPKNPTVLKAYQLL